MYNKTIIVGNLGKDPEMRYTPAGQAVTSFSVATNRKYTDKSGAAVSETAWWRVEAWGKTAEITNEYLKKGSEVLVEGRIKVDPATGGPRVWQNKETGAYQASLELTAENVRFLGKTKAQGGDAGGDDFQP